MTTPDANAEIARLRARLALAESAIAGHSEVAYLILILCKIREVTGVGMTPMLSELPEAIAAKIAEGAGHATQTDFSPSTRTPDRS
jgi:hypothetical protein